MIDPPSWSVSQETRVAFAHAPAREEYRRTLCSECSDGTVITDPRGKLLNFGYEPEICSD